MQSYRPKGLVLLTMRTISLLGGKADALAIGAHIERITGSRLPENQANMMLCRLRNRRLVASETIEKVDNPGRGRPRLLFSLTESGKRSLEFELSLLMDSKEAAGA